MVSSQLIVAALLGLKPADPARGYWGFEPADRRGVTGAETS